MIPIYQTWRRGTEIVSLKKDHAGAGYFIDLQGDEHVKAQIEARIALLSDLAFERNSTAELDQEKGRVVTVRGKSTIYSGAELLVRVGIVLTELGFMLVE